jgi:signal peptidase II
MKTPLLIVFFVLLVDQAIKFYIKTHFFLGEEYHVAGNWFILHFTENNGMAFGMEFAGRYGKLFLSIFRIGAVAAIGYYLYDLVKKNAPIGLLISISLILAGALGNIIDSSFYGLLFSDSNYEVASFLPKGGGYAGFLHGRVVDMFYFPIIEGHFPSWFPIWGTEEFIFFRPVFNFSDSSISVGVFLILLFQRKFFTKTDTPKSTLDILSGP